MAKRQMELVKPEKQIDEVDRAADAYRGVRDKRMELTKKEVETNAILLGVLKKHKLSTYTYRDGDETFVVSIKTAEEKAKVKRLGSRDEEEE